MKTKITNSILFLVLLITQFSWAQAPNKMSYQTLLKNASGVPITVSNVGIQISILTSSPVGTSVFVERHTVTTNSSGLATFIIGNGTVQSGSFTAIDWSNNSYFIKTEVDPTGGTTYSISNTSQLLSVPYALYAQKTNETDPKVGATTNEKYVKWNNATNKLVDGVLAEFGSNVGIGTTTPSSKLEVVGKIKTTDFQLSNGATANYFLKTDAFGNASWSPMNEIDPEVLVTTTNAVPRWDGTKLIGGVISDNGTNIGIGTSIPTQKLDVAGNIKSNEMYVSDYSRFGDIFVTNNLDPKVFINTTGDRPLFTGSTTNGKGITLGFNGNDIQGRGGLDFFDNSDLILNNYGGNVGIATSTPTEKLDVNGKTKTTNIQVTSGATTGFVLSSDAAGNGTWVNPTTLETDPQVALTTTNFIPKWNGTALVDGKIFDNGTNIGIGTSAPSSPLHVTAGGVKSSSFTANMFENNVSTSSAATINKFALEIKSTGSWAGSNSRNVGLYVSNTSGGSYNFDAIFNGGGAVGIGTLTPTQGKLVINGGQSQSITNYGYLNTGGAGSFTGTSANSYSIYASDRIAASEFNAFSDERIKNIKGISNRKKDLEILNKIEITDYKLKDTIAKGNNEYKKVIAQQIEKVYPQAVSLMTDVVPDIYKQAEMKNGFISLKNNLKVGEKVKLIKASGDEIVEVVEANINGFKINSDNSEKIFVYGRQVNDFHTVDYEALATLNISATQELFNEIQKLKAENAELKTDNNYLKAEVASMAEVKKDVEMLKIMLQSTSALNKN